MNEANILDMEALGTIEPDAGTVIERDAWIALIATHPSLAPVQPRQGNNPFTKEPHMYKAAPDHALVLLDDTKVGAIHWAIDAPHRLIVSSMPKARTHVIAVAHDVASSLGGRFLPGT